MTPAEALPRVTIEVGKAYVVSCPDRDGLRIAQAVAVTATEVTVRLRDGTGGMRWIGIRWSKTPRTVPLAAVRREATAREVAVALAIH